MTPEELLAAYHDWIHEKAVCGDYKTVSLMVGAMLREGTEALLIMKRHGNPLNRCPLDEIRRLQRLAEGMKTAVWTSV